MKPAIKNIFLLIIFALVVPTLLQGQVALPFTNVKIFGGDELYPVDVVREDNVNKLLVKSTTVPDTVSEFVFGKFLTPGGSSDMTVNGSGTNVVFSVSAHPTKKTVVREIKFTAFDGGIKVDKFLGNNSSLTNGVLVRITVNGLAQDFLPIQTTQDFDGHFAYGSGARFEIISASGNDSMVAQFSPIEPIVFSAGSTDKIEIIIRDSLTQISFLEAVAFGFYD